MYCRYECSERVSTLGSSSGVRGELFCLWGSLLGFAPLAFCFFPLKRLMKKSLDDVLAMGEDLDCFGEMSSSLTGS